MAPQKVSTVYVVTRGDNVDVYATLDAAVEAAEPFDDAVVHTKDIIGLAKGSDKKAATDSKEKEKAAGKTTSKTTKATKATKDAPQVTDPRALHGRSVVVTGAIEGLTRPQVEAVITNAGGRVLKAISRNVDLVVLGYDAGPKKLEQIEELGIETIEYGELVRIVGAGGGGDGKKRGAGDEGAGGKRRKR